MKKMRKIAVIFICVLLTSVMLISLTVSAAEDDFYFEHVFDDGGWFALEGLRVTNLETARSKASGEIIGYIWTAQMVYGQPLTLQFRASSDGMFIHMKSYYFDGSTDITPYARFEVTDGVYNLPRDFPYDRCIDWEEYYFDAYDSQGNLINAGQLQGTYTFTVPEQASQFWLRIHSFQGELYFFVTVVDAPGGITQNVTTDAEQTPGEDSGTEIIPEILNPRPRNDDNKDGSTAAAVAVSAAGALAAAGALSSSSGKKKQEEEQRKRYKMYVYKAFGDAIQKGGQPLKVFCRVSQIIEGKEYDCPEQTVKIRSAGENLNVRQTGIEGAYMAAEVTAPQGTDAEKGTVIFTLSGPGGTVRRSVVFRLVEEPRIAFPRDTGDGHWDLNSDLSTVKMVAGEGGKERLRFVILDAVEEPKVIQFIDHDGFIIDYEHDPKLGFTYYALIDNHTDRIEKRGGIFADKEDRHITIEAIFGNGLRINNYFTVELYPDGLAVSPARDIVKNDRMVIDTVENMNAGAGHAKIQPVLFDFTVCYVEGATGKSTILKNPSCNHEDPTDNGRYGMLFLYNFEYQLRHGGKTGLMFYPLRTLPSLAQPYEATMRLIYDSDRAHFDGDIPLAVYGERPSRPSSAEWNKAYEWLKRDISYFGLGNDPQLKAMLEHINDHSATQIADIRKAVINAGVVFYKQNREAYEQYEAMCTRYILVASTLVKACDMALEYGATYYFSGYGKIAMNFINPLKNLLAEYAGEYLANGNIDAAPDFIETVLKASESTLSTAITGIFFGDSALDQGVDTTITLGGKIMRIKRPPVSDELKKVLGYVIAVYLLTCFARHYNYGQSGEKGDVYRSAIAALADLGLESFKAWFLGFIVNRCTGLFEKIAKACGDKFKEICKGRIKEMADEAGKKAFGDSIRGSLKTDLRGLTRESLNTARNLRDAAFKETKELKEGLIDNGARFIGETGKKGIEWVSESASVAMILNYMMGGDSDGTETLGPDTKEVIYNALAKWIGVKLGKVYEGGNVLNPYDVTVRIEDGKIIIGLLGYCAEINILENIAALADMVYQMIFTWMSGCWQKVKESLDFGDMPDARDQMETDPDEIGRKLEEQKQRVENNEWRFH